MYSVVRVKALLAHAISCCVVACCLHVRVRGACCLYFALWCVAGCVAGCCVLYCVTRVITL
jgi:hypothetical protein